MLCCRVLQCVVVCWLGFGKQGVGMFTYNQSIFTYNQCCALLVARSVQGLDQLSVQGLESRAWVYGAGIYSCGQTTLDPAILEAGRKFSFEINKHENQNYWLDLSVNYQLFLLNICCFQFVPNWFRLFPAASKIGRSKVVYSQVYMLEKTACC